MTSSEKVLVVLWVFNGLGAIAVVVLWAYMLHLDREIARETRRIEELESRRDRTSDLKGTPHAEAGNRLRDR
jgi:hypothetical protein